MKRNEKRWTDEKFIEVVKSSKGIKEILEKLEIDSSNHFYKTIKNDIARLGIDISHFRKETWNRITIEQMKIALVESSSIPQVLKKMELRTHFENYSKLKNKIVEFKLEEFSQLTKRMFKPKKSGYLDSHGYHRIGNKKVHRIVMEQMMGRELLTTENVHHKNGDRADNRPENLELWINYQPRGQRIDDQIGWAVEMLNRYAPELLNTDNINKIKCNDEIEIEIILPENRNGKALRKLTNEEVKAIRIESKNGFSRSKLAEKYKVSMNTIHAIVKRLTYKEVE